METSMLAEARAAHRDTWYFPEGGRVTPAEVVGCICVDHLTCTECDRILADPLLAIELAAPNEKHTDPAVPVARDDDGRLEQELGPGSHNGVEGFEAAIYGMAVRLGLGTSVGERAKEVFRKMEEAGAWPHHRPGWTKERGKGALYAACLSIACHNEGSPRSLRELAQAATGCGEPVRKEEIARMTAHIRRRLGEATKGVGAVTVSSYLRRFGALVGLADAEASAALEAARRLDEGTLDVRHNAESLAAAIACMALERAGVRRKPARDVAAATGVSYHTVRRVCRSLGPHADLLFL